VLSAALDSICRGAANEHEHLGASQGVNSQINYLSMFLPKQKQFKFDRAGKSKMLRLNYQHISDQRRKYYY
jgi:hypothetical protein